MRNETYCSRNSLDAKFFRSKKKKEVSAWSTEVFLLENFLGFGLVRPQASPRGYFFLLFFTFSLDFLYFSLIGF